MVISASNDIIKYSFESPDKNDAISYAEKNIFEIGQKEERSDLTLIKDSMPEVMEKFENMMEYVAKIYIKALNAIHYMHDKYAYEK